MSKKKVVKLATNITTGMLKVALESTSKDSKKKAKVDNVYSMHYDLWIGGKKIGLTRKSCITSISIKETDEGSDSATLTIKDPDFLFINDNIYIENRKVKIHLGFQSYKYRVKFNGYISAVDINFDSSGIPTLNITCMDNSYRMNRKKKNATFSNTTSASVVRKKCKEYGFKCVVQSDYDFPVQESITQSSQTDIDFITSLAQNEVYPFTARLVGDTFYYVKRGKLEKKASHTLHYMEYPNDIISFSPRVNTEEKEITKGTTNTATKKSENATTSNSSANVSSNESKNPDDRTTNSRGKDTGGYHMDDNGNWNPI